MVSQLKKVLMKKPQKFMSKVDCNKWNYQNPLNQSLINDNYDQFHSIIINSKVEIFFLELQDNNEELCDSIFTHDPSLVIDHGAIILNMTKELRMKEVKEHVNFYKNFNVPIIGEIVENGKVEGGDCLWINNKLLLIGESSRTNINGIYQLNNILKKFDINIVTIKLPKNSKTNSCFHLMSIMSMLDHDLIIGYKKFMTEELLYILTQNKIKIIEIPEDEYLNSQTLAVNILALSPRNLVMLKGYNKTSDLLYKENCNLNLFNGNELCIKTEGGPTCLTRPILRI